MISAEHLMAFPGIFFRVLGMLIVLPIAHNLSGIGKIFGLSFGLSLFFAPNVAAENYPGMQCLFFEFLAGCIISLPAALTIDAVRSLGELFDSQRGVSFASLYDPSANQNISVMSHLASNYSLAVLIGGGIFENILFALKNSFDAVPIYSYGSASISSSAISTIRLISFICSGMFQSFLICALLFVLVDFGSIFLAKVLTQSGLNQEVFLVKTICGLLLIFSLLKINFAPALISFGSPQAAILSPLP
jgi:flagellar biosynthesis protein FliR